MVVVCPTDVVEAPVETVWRLLTEPAGWGGFFDLRILRVEPPGSAAVGQCVHGVSGPAVLRLGISFRFTHVDAEHHVLGMDIRLPLGITVTETLGCAALGPDRCRVSYGCDFGLPRGWRGRLLETVLRRELVRGPADSLARLKAAAERANADLQAARTM